jgi:hypothetical protein
MSGDFGSVPSVVDMLSEIDRWVETGIKPEWIIATRSAARGRGRF